MLIRVAIEIVKESGQAMLDMPLLILFPIIPFVIALVYAGWFIYMSLILFSVSSLESYTSGYDLAHYSFGYGWDKFATRNDIDTNNMFRFQLDEEVRRT